MSIADEVIYAIPSRARAETLARKTIPLLDRLGIDRSRIRVFVTEDEIPAYRTALPSGVTVERGALGGPENRNRILDAFESGAAVISIDDDIRDLIIRADSKRSIPITPDEYRTLVEDGFATASRVGARIWGCYPVPNAFFMKPRWRTDLCYLGGALTGYISDRDPDSPLRVSMKYKHDFERSVQCYVADGALARCEYVSWRTEGYSGAGGLQSDGDRAEIMLDLCEGLVARYPGLVTLNLTKKSGWPEVRLADRRARMPS